MVIFCKHTLIDDYTAVLPVWALKIITYYTNPLIIEIIMYLTVKASNVHATLHNMTVQ